MTRVALLLVLAAACYQPSFDQLACGPGDACPDGLRCELGVCVDDALAVDAAPRDSATPVDAAPRDSATPVDAASHDSAPPVDAPPPIVDASPPIVDASPPIVDAPPPPVDASPVICGNGIAEPGEACDDGNTTTESSCTYGEPTCQACDGACAAVLDLVGPYCGDGIVQAPKEECDGAAAFAPCCDHCINVCW